MNNSKIILYRFVWEAMVNANTLSGLFMNIKRRVASNDVAQSCEYLLKYSLFKSNHDWCLMTIACKMSMYSIFGLG
jgi:hypothetical protein